MEVLNAGAWMSDLEKQDSEAQDTLTVIPDSRHRLQKWARVSVSFASLKGGRGARYATELRDFLESDHQDLWDPVLGFGSGRSWALTCRM